MSDSKKDDLELFGDSDSGGDTDELVSTARSQQIAAKPKKKKRLQKKKDKSSRKKNIPDADEDSDSDAFGDSDGEGKSKSKKSPKRPLSKKEKMEQLAKRKRAIEAYKEASKHSTGNPDKERERDPSASADKDRSGYDSGDSYNSGTFERTKEDIDFIDHDGEDEYLRKEYEAEQHFDDERGSGTDSEDERGNNGRSNKRQKKAANKKKSLDALSDDDMDLDENGVPSNPIVAAVRRMKKNKKVKKDLSQVENEVKDFLTRMELAADDDDKSVKMRKPAMKKLAMLQEVLQMLAKVDMMRMLLDLDLLLVCKRWIQPLPDKTLGNLTIRQRLLEAIANMNGSELGVTSEDLKRSSFGKVVMALYMHPSETIPMKRQLKQLIEQWSRPIFHKEGNMKQLHKVQRIRRDAGMYSSASVQQKSPTQNTSSRRNTDDLNSIIAQGYQSKAGALGNNRVRVPYSKGFQFTIRPQDKIDPSKGRRADGPRNQLNKRMVQKNRPISKNKRSMDMSADGKGL